MKNVTLARQAVIGTTEVGTISPSNLRLVRTTERTSSRATTTCTMIEGTGEQQAQALASLLLAARA
jgi:hypothetical protein